MKQHTLFVGAALLVALPTLALLPGCSGGNSNIVTPTATPTVPPTSTPVAPPTPTPTAPPAVGTANISFVASNGVYFGPSPYSVNDVTADDQNGTDLSIGFAPFFNGSDARYFTLSLHHVGAIQNGQTFSLQSGGSTLIASAPSSAGSLDYVSYGGTGFTTGSAKVTRSGNVATFTLQNVVVRNNDNTVGQRNGTLTFNASITVTLPPSAR